MNILSKLSKQLSLLIALFLVASSPVLAQYGGGGGDDLSVLIDKTIAKPGTCSKGNPSSGNYRDNLSSSSDEIFQPSELICFRVRVKNTSNRTLDDIVVRDIFPEYVNPLVGPGVYDAERREIRYEIDSLGEDQENIQYIEARIVDTNDLPDSDSIIRQVNKVDARSENAFDEDTAQFFVENTDDDNNVGSFERNDNVQGTTTDDRKRSSLDLDTVPKTGPQLGLAFLALQAVGLGVGVYMRKKI